jgi:hypothetical protein
MISAFGDEYRSYMQRTARVIPWVTEGIDGAAPFPSSPREKNNIGH